MLSEAVVKHAAFHCTDVEVECIACLYIISYIRSQRSLLWCSFSIHPPLGRIVQKRSMCPGVSLCVRVKLALWAATQKPALVEFFHLFWGRCTEVIFLAIGSQWHGEIAGKMPEVMISQHEYISIRITGRKTELILWLAVWTVYYTRPK